jgi:mRNA-degrading endonuclease toxin of MazEF toxin-antitoxin module
MAVEPDRIRRGAVVIVQLPEDNKAGRPAVVVRSDALAATPWAAVLPFTSDLDTDMPHWPRVEPTLENGLRQVSRVMTDWPQTVWCRRIQEVAGRLDAASMATATGLLAAALGTGEDVRP